MAIFNPVLSAIFSRKSVRHFTSSLVSRESIALLLRAGMSSPSARNLQPWEFIVIENRSNLDILATGLDYGKMLFESTAAIAVCGDLSVNSSYWVQDCSAATMNILLAATSLSLGSVWLGIYPREDRVSFIRSTLKLPSTLVPLNIIALGHSTDLSPVKDKYKPSKIHWESY